MKIIQNIKAWKTTALGMFFIAMTTYGLFEDKLTSDLLILGLYALGVLLLLAPDKVPGWLVKKTTNE